jgi:hypothetical protein
MGPFPAFLRPHCLPDFQAFQAFVFSGPLKGPAPHTARPFRALWVGPFKPRRRDAKKNTKTNTNIQTYKHTKTKTQTQTQTYTNTNTTTKRPKENIFFEK